MESGDVFHTQTYSQNPLFFILKFHKKAKIDIHSQLSTLNLFIFEELFCNVSRECKTAFVKSCIVVVCVNAKTIPTSLVQVICGVEFF